MHPAIGAGAGACPAAYAEILGAGIVGDVIAAHFVRGLAQEPRTAAVLLTNNEGNVGFYERFGFETVIEETMPDGGPVTWAMRRRPS